MKRSKLATYVQTGDRQTTNSAKAQTGTPNYTAVYDSLVNAIDDIATEASTGDSSAFTFLLNCSIEFSTIVRQVATNNPKLASKLAKRLPAWPVLLYPSPSLNGWHKSFIEKIHLGEEFSMPIDLKRAYRGATNPRKIAIFLIQMTEQFRRLARSVFKTKLEVDLRETSPGSSINKKPAKANILQRSSNVTDQKRIDSIKGWLDLLANVLEVPFAVTKMDSSFLVAAISLPALTQETVGQWAAYGKAIIYCMTEQKPENNPVLRKIGRYRKDVYYRKDTTPSTFKERTKAARGTENSNIRDGIFTRIKAAYPKVIKDRGKKLSASKASRSNRAPNKGET